MPRKIKRKQTPMEVTEEMIRQRAYELYCERGENSDAAQNWMDAKLELEHQQLMESRIDDEKKER